MAEKLVLAHCGLDASVMIHKIKEKYGYDIVTSTAHVGRAKATAKATAKARRSK